MKKEEFENKLREKLSILDAKEIDDIIEEYLGYIDEKMQKGAKEEEAIKDFGDIDELARELLKAYKINVEQPKEKNILNILVEKISGVLDSLIKVFENKDGHEILRMIIEIIMILLCISLCKIPFHFLEDIGFDVFMPLQNNFGRVLYRIWKLIIEFTYLILAIVLFIKIFEKRYFANLETKQEIKTKNASKKMEPKKEKKAEKKEEKIIVENPHKTGVIDLLTTICIWFLKFIASLFLMGIACCILGLAICVGMSLYLMANGVSYIGIYISVFVLLILGILSFTLLFNWIFNRKNNIKFLLIGYLISFVILGISFSYASIEIATTRFINHLPEHYQMQEKIEIINFDENDILVGNYTFEIDESLTNEIKVSYQYPTDLYEITTNINSLSLNRIYLNWNYEENHWKNRVLEDIIKDLKNHQIHNYAMIPKITVYTSSKNIEILRKNHRSWKNEGRYQNQYYEYCENLYEENEMLPHYCKELLFSDYYD